MIGDTGIVTKDLKSSLEAMAGKCSIDSLQKTTVLGISYIMQKVLQSETWSTSGGDNSWLKRRSAGGEKDCDRRNYDDDDDNNADLGGTGSYLAHYS